MHHHFKRALGMLLFPALLLCSCDGSLVGGPEDPPHPPPPPPPSGGIPFTVTGDLVTWEDIRCEADDTNGAYYTWSYKEASENDDQYHQVDEAAHLTYFCFTEPGSYVIKLEVAPGAFTTRELQIAESPPPADEHDVLLEFTKVADGTYAGNLSCSDDLLKPFRRESKTGEFLDGLSISFQSIFPNTRMYYYIYYWKPSFPGGPTGFQVKDSDWRISVTEFVALNEMRTPDEFPGVTPLGEDFAIDDIRKIRSVRTGVYLDFETPGGVETWSRYYYFEKGYLVITGDPDQITVQIPMDWENIR